MAQGGVTDSSVSSRRSSGGVHATDDPLLSIRRRSCPRDVAALAGVPAVLLFVYALPATTKWDLALSYADPTALTAFTSHFVHVSPDHLVVNVVGYALVAPLGYLLALASGRRRQFLVVFLTYVLAFPFVLSGFNLLWGWEGVRLGFSGIVVAFVGYLPVVLLRFVGVRFGLPVDELRSLWLFFVGLAIASVIALPSAYSAAFATVAVFATGVFLWQAAADLDRTTLAETRVAVATAGNVELALLGGSVFVLYPLVAFSPDLLVDGRILNVYTHGLGLCFGYAVAYLGVLTGWLDVD